MQIVGLRAENFKRLRVVELDKLGQVIQITGKNAAGKSSVLDAIASALCGKNACPAVPIRQGEKSAEVSVALSNGLEVTRRWNEKGNTTLVVRSKDGRMASPQEVLDKLVSEVAMDPLAFYRMKPERRRAAIADAAGVLEELEQLDRDYDAVYLARREANRDARLLRSRVGEEPTRPEEAAASAGTVAEAMQAYEKRLEQRKRSDRLDDLARAAASAADAENRRVADLERQLADAKKRFELATAEATAAHQNAVDCEQVDDASLQDARDAVDRARMREIAEKDHQAWEERNVAAAQSEAAANRIDASVQACAAKRDELLQRIVPIPSLQVTESDVLWNGLPLDQASQAERVRISAAIAMQQNRELRVMLLRDGNLLDSESFHALCWLAQQHDVQVWIEQVDEDGEVGIYLEDGEVESIDGEEV